MSSLLLYLQVLLSNPELDMECVRNYSAAEVLTRAPRTYTQTVMDCVLASIKKDGKKVNLKYTDCLPDYYTDKRSGILSRDIFYSVIYPTMGGHS